MELKLTYILHCINVFAAKNKLNIKEAYHYLKKYGGLNFLDEFYEVEHQLSLQETIADLIIVCKRNGGYLL